MIAGIRMISQPVTLTALLGCQRSTSYRKRPLPRPSPTASKQLTMLGQESANSGQALGPARLTVALCGRIDLGEKQPRPHATITSPG